MNTDWSKPTKYIVGVSLALLGIYLLHLSRPVIPLLILAALIAVIVRPLVLYLQVEGHLPRGLAVALVYLAGLILVPLALLLAVPAIVNAINYVLTIDYPSVVRNVTEWLRNTLVSIRDMRLPVTALDTYVDQMVNAFLVELQRATPATVPQPPSVTTILQSLGAVLTTTFGAAASLLGTVLSQGALLIFMFLASIYISLSAHTYRSSFLSIIPPAYQPEIDQLLGRIVRLWNSFFRGEITLMLVIGVLSWLGLSVLGVPGALSLGIIAGLLELIPNLGPIIATIPAIIVALLQGSSYLPVSNLTMGLLVLGFYVLLQQLENSVIVPRVLGDAVELPPLVVMTGVLVGATTFGILGALLATPVVATGREILRYVYFKMLGQNPFPPGEKVPSRAAGAALRPVVGLRRRLRGWARRLRGSPPPAPPSAGEAGAEAFPQEE